MLRDGVGVNPVCVAALDLIWLDQVLGWLGSCSKFWKGLGICSCSLALMGRQRTERSDVVSGVRPRDRPTKTCPVCGKPFQWRKKWKDVWDEVRYCSERCRRQKKSPIIDRGV